MRTLAGRGYAVVVYYVRDQRGAEAAVEEVLATNGSALTVRGHVADELDVERLFAETIKAFGGVDVVVHAGRTDQSRSGSQRRPRHVRCAVADKRSRHVRREPEGGA